MIWNRERYIAHCMHEDTGREMFCELFGPLHVLEDEWRKQGASEAEISMRAFDWDYVPTVWLAGQASARTGIAPVVIEDTPQYTIATDSMGRRTKLIKKSATIALPQDHPVSCPDDWERIKHWYTFDERRINKELLLAQKRQWEAGHLSMINILGAFDEPRQLMGEEALCIACYEEPHMLHDMLK